MSVVMKVGSTASLQKFLASTYNFKNFIKSNKIPEYARDYKREYLFVKGLNLQFEYFNKKLEYLNNGLFETELAKEIKFYMKGFLRRQKENKFKNLANIIYFADNFLDHIYFMNQNFDCYKLRYDAFCDDGKDYNDYLSDTSDTSDTSYDEDDDVEYSDEYIEYLRSINSKKEYLVDGKPYPGFIEFYDIFKQIFNQIKKDDESDIDEIIECDSCLLYTSPSPRDRQKSRMPSSA